MTICLAAKCDSGIVVASDSLICVGETQLTKPNIKARTYPGMVVLYSGTLSAIQHVLDSEFGVPRDLQQRLWNVEKKYRKEPAEYLVVFDKQIYILSNHGEILSGFDYACIGSEFGWLGLDLLMPDLRNPTFTNVKNKLIKVMRAVARRDTSVDGPYYAELVAGK